jgi:hypothetical protein
LRTYDLARRVTVPEAKNPVQENVYWLRPSGSANDDSTGGVASRFDPDLAISTIFIDHNHQEENYRLLIDELPGKPSRGKASVSLLIRKSLPIRIAGAEIAPGQLEWAVLKKRGKTELTAKNTSGQRIKISGLKVLSADDRQLLHLKGLSGYVLGGSFKRWILPSNAGKLGLGQTIRISGKTDTGRINSHASVQAGN